VSLHGAFQFLSAGSCLQVERSIERIEFEEVAVCFAGRRAWAAITDAIEGAGTPSGNAVRWAGMFQINQCVQVPLGASGSSTISASESAAGETPFQLSAGDKSAPSHVCRFGISPPFANAVAFIARDIAIPFFGSQDPEFQRRPRAQGHLPPG